MEASYALLLVMELVKEDKVPSNFFGPSVSGIDGFSG